MSDLLKTDVVTGEVRFSYLNVFHPKDDGKGGLKYSVMLLIPKKDKKTVAAVEAAVEAAIENGKASKFGGKTKGLKLPLRDGDEEREEEECAGHWFINASGRRKPGIVDEDLQQIINPDQLYSGCYGRAAINFYAFSTDGNRGVACGLNHVQKLRDGEPLGGGSKAEDVFAAPAPKPYATKKQAPKDEEDLF